MKKQIILCLLMMNFSSTSWGNDIVHKSTYFALSVPPAFGVHNMTPVEDFEIHAVRQSEKTYVSIYVGNQPSFPKYKPNKDEQVTEFRANGVQIRTVWQKGEIVLREILLRRTKNGWPSYIHAWIAKDVSKSEIHIADRILMSLNTTEE